MDNYKRKEIIGDCTLYLGDCLDVIPILGTVNHIISDPPYEQKLHDSNKRKRTLRKDGGNEFKKFNFEGIDFIRKDFSDLCSISKGWIILFCIAEGVAAWERALDIYKYDTTLAWIKPDAAPRFNGQGAARGFECAVTAYAGTGHKKWNGGGKRGVYTHNVNTQERKYNGGHPTEKPINLMKEILMDFTNQGETILDPFMGSGTTGVACVNLGRKFTGIELSEKYFDIACERIERAHKQVDMFVQKPILENMKSKTHNMFEGE